MPPAPSATPCSNFAKMRSTSRSGSPPPKSSTETTICASRRCARRRTTVPAGVCLAAFSSRLPSACSTSVASTRTSGRSSGSSTTMRCEARRSARRRSTEPVISASEAQSRSSSSAPDSRRVICSTLETCSDISRAWSKTLRSRARRSSGPSPSPISARVDEAPVITASGVRRSWEIEASSALRMRSVSASSASAACARSRARTSSARREITSATASMMANVSRYCRSSTVKVPWGGTKTKSNASTERIEVATDGAAGEAQRDERDAEHVDHRDVDEVEARAHGEAQQRACRRRARRPGVAAPGSPPIHATLYRRAAVKIPLRIGRGAGAAGTARLSCAAMNAISRTLSGTPPAGSGSPLRHGTAALALLALGVVYGDIGTSPLYAVKETFNPEHGIALNAENILGGDIGDLLGADGRGLAQVRDAGAARGQPRRRRHHGACSRSPPPRWASARACGRCCSACGVFGASLFYGDAVLTPAISVLSAVEGLEVGTAAFKPYIVPIVHGHPRRALPHPAPRHRRGRHRCSGRSARCGSPPSAPWARGTSPRRRRCWPRSTRATRCASPPDTASPPSSCWARCSSRSPAPRRSTPTWVTSASAPMRIAWFGVVAPALVLNYFGQGALLIANPRRARQPVLPGVSAVGALPDGGARHGGHGDRLAGDDLRRVLDDAAGDPARLPAAHGDPPHLRDAPWARSTSRR